MQKKHVNKTLQFSEAYKELEKEMLHIEAGTRHWLWLLENPGLKDEDAFHKRDRIIFRKKHPLLKRVDSATTLMESSFYLACSGRYYAANILTRTWFEILIKGACEELMQRTLAEDERSFGKHVVSKIYEKLIKKRFPASKLSNENIWEIIKPHSKFGQKRINYKKEFGMRKYTIDYELKEAHRLYLFYSRLSKYTHGNRRVVRHYTTPVDNNPGKIMRWWTNILSKAMDYYLVMINKREWSDEVTRLYSKKVSTHLVS